MDYAGSHFLEAARCGVHAIPSIDGVL